MCVSVCAVHKPFKRSYTPNSSLRICLYLHIMNAWDCVCAYVCVWGSYSVALLTGACLSLAVTLLLAETEMDSHAAVEGQGYSWLSPSPVHQQHKHTNTGGQAHFLY